MGLTTKTALVCEHDLEEAWIISHDPDRSAELDMVYMQMKLLVSHYLRNRYNVVVDAPYRHTIAGEVHSYEEEIDQLRTLMRAMPVTPLTVHVYDGSRRTAVASPSAAYAPRNGQGDLKFDVALVTPERIAETVAGIAGGD
jgi:hypothetical protein